jgi:hypothetical protein
VYRALIFSLLVFSAGIVSTLLHEFGHCLFYWPMRDYSTPPPPGTMEEHPYGRRMWAGRSYDVKQIWSWYGNEYDITFVITDVDQDAPVAHVITWYCAIPPNRVTELMIDVGFTDVR